MTAQWALIGKEGEAFTEKAAEVLGERSPFEIKRDKGNLYFRTSYKDKTHGNSIKVSPVITQKNYKDPYLYKFFKYKHRMFQLANAGRLAKEPPENYIKIFNKNSGFRRFDKMARVIFLAANDQLPGIFTEFLSQYYFDQYPEGVIRVISTDSDLHTKLAALRVLGVIDRIAKRDMNKIHKFENFMSLSNLQPSGIANPGKYFTIPLAMSLPNPIGFIASRIADCVIFLFDSQLDDVRKPFPKSGIEFYRSSASSLFKENTEVDENRINNNMDFNDTFRLIPQNFSMEVWWKFIKQYSNKLNHFLLYLTDPSNFVSHNGDWANLTHYLVWLSFERLCDETILLLTEENHYLRKMAAFRIMDQLASLRHKKASKQVNLFKTFIIPTDGVDPIEYGLIKYRGKIPSYLNSRLIELRKNLKSSVLASLQFGGTYDQKNDKVVLPDGEHISANAYVRDVVREIRNTAHGYSSGHNNLHSNSGSIPDDFPLLGVLAFLAFIASPAEFLRPAWE